MAIGVDSTGRSFQKLSTDAEHILAPHVALEASKSEKRVLIVFDDVFMHSLKEKHVYDLASQPAPPKLILNELMEATGIFSDGREVTSIVIADTDSSTLQVQKDEDDLVAHIESIADHVITFDCEQSKKRLGARNLPILQIKPSQVYMNQKQWLNPFVMYMANRFQTMTDNIDKAYVEHTGKKMMKIHEDPWDNFLYYDSKYLLPMICHTRDLPIEEQLVVSFFIECAIAEETISQYVLTGDKLVAELLKFVKTLYGGGDGSSSVHDRPQAGLDQNDLDFLRLDDEDDSEPRAAPL